MVLSCWGCSAQVRMTSREAPSSCWWEKSSLGFLQGCPICPHGARRGSVWESQAPHLCLCIHCAHPGNPLCCLGTPETGQIPGRALPSVPSPPGLCRALGAVGVSLQPQQCLWAGRAAYPAQGCPWAASCPLSPTSKGSFPVEVG